MGAAPQVQVNDAWKRWAGQVAGGRFPLRQYLGSSDHSVVYLTERFEQRPQKATIKFIPDQGGAEEQLSRWLTIAKLSHPHLLRLFETGRCELGGTKLLYVVMEYAEESLSQILPERALRPDEARDMLPPILSALHYLHGNRFIHARLKPSNILAAGDQLKISCDGLRSMGESVHPKTAGKCDAPETGHESLSPASDVWSLGVTIVEVLTQRVPESAAQTEPKVPPTVPQPFLEIAQNCLRLYPQRRWTLWEIDAALSGSSRKSEQKTRQNVFLNWRYIVPGLAVAAILAALLIGPGLSGRNAVAPPSSPEEAQASAAPPEAKPKTSKAEPELSKPEAGKGAAPYPAGGGSAAPTTAPRPAESAPNSGPTAEGAARAVVHRVIPDVPLSARNTITGKVRVWVRVTVDSSGNVTDTTFDRPGPSKYFARLAKQAAEGWKFSPAQVNGQYVSSEWVLRFQFGRESTEVFPAPATGPTAKP